MPIETSESLSEDRRGILRFLEPLHVEAHPLWAIGDQGVLSATRFLITFLIGAYGAQEELGIYSLGFSILVFLTTIQESLITTPLQVFHPRLGAKEQSTLAGNLFLASALVAVLGISVIGLTVYGFRFWKTRSELEPILVVLAFSLPFHLFREYGRRWQFVHGRVRSVALLDMLFSIVQVAGLLVWIRVRSIDANHAIMMMGLASLVFCLVAYFRLGNHFEFSFSAIGSDYARNWRYGRWIAISSLCAVGQTYFANWYLATRLGLEEAAIYTVCSTMAMLANPFLLGISSVHGPQASRAFVEKGVPGVFQSVLKNLGIISVILGCYTALLAALGEWFAEWLFGSSFAGQRWPILFLSLAIMGQGVNYIVANGLCAINFPQMELIAGLIGVLFGVALTLIFPPSVFFASLAFFLGVAAMALFRFGALVHLSKRAI